MAEVLFVRFCGESAFGVEPRPLTNAPDSATPAHQRGHSLRIAGAIPCWQLLGDPRTAAATPRRGGRQAGRCVAGRAGRSLAEHRTGKRGKVLETTVGPNLARELARDLFIGHEPAHAVFDTAVWPRGRCAPLWTPGWTVRERPLLLARSPGQF